MKTCILCKIEKPLEDFNKSKHRPGGYRNECKNCKNVRARAYIFEPSNILEKTCRKCNITKLIKHFQGI